MFLFWFRYIIGHNPYDNWTRTSNYTHPDCSRWSSIRWCKSVSLRMLTDANRFWCQYVYLITGSIKHAYLISLKEKKSCIDLNLSIKAIKIKNMICEKNKSWEIVECEHTRSCGHGSARSCRNNKGYNLLPKIKMYA